MDEHIDYFEVGEYGDHFVKESAKLVGLDKLVDVEELRLRVRAAIAAVDTELGKAGLTRSSARGTSGATIKADAKLKRTITRFWKHLGTVDDEIVLDVPAFFPGGKLGSLAALKPADVQKKADKALLGFEVDTNAALPEAERWKARLSEDRAALAAALEGRGDSRSQSVVATAGLVEARKAFLVLYNGVAKKLILGLLTALGRKGEQRLFFKDLQVDEGGGPTKDYPATDPSAPST